MIIHRIQIEIKKIKVRRKKAGRDDQSVVYRFSDQPNLDCKEIAFNKLLVYNLLCS